MLKERKTPNLNKKNLTQYTEIRNQQTTTINRQRSGLKLELQNGRTHRIGDQSSLPRRVPDSTTPQPQASLLSQSQGISSLHLTSLSFSLLQIWVIGFGLMGFSLSRSLSLYLKNESEMK